jgi:hypothetical protein
MASPLDPRLTALVNPDLLFAEPERVSDMGFWHEHIPFAFVLADLLAPRNFVELGAHKGDSYFAFCQAVSRLGLPTRCFAVDSWEGDVHTSAYAETVFTEFKQWHDARYAAFSTPLRMTFDEAAGKFDNGSIDLLHIDGTHTYDAVKHDFETWLPKMSSRGVVLFHDVAVRRDEFGVWKLWDEVSQSRPHFAFRHGNGLGVLATGSELPPRFSAFLELAQAMPDAVRALFEAFGQRIARGAATTSQAARIAQLEKTQAELFNDLDSFRTELDNLAKTHATLIGQRDTQDAYIMTQQHALETLQRELMTTQIQLAARQADLAGKQGELAAVYASTSWKITGPMRRLMRLLRGS